MASTLFEHLEDLAADIRRADRVEQDFHPEARLRLGRERVCELAPDLAGPVDVGLDGDRDLRGPDCAEHLRVERIAVVEAARWRCRPETGFRSRRPSSREIPANRRRTRDRAHIEATPRPGSAGSTGATSPRLPPPRPTRPVPVAQRLTAAQGHHDHSRRRARVQKVREPFGARARASIPGLRQLRRVWRRCQARGRLRGRGLARRVAT
jgi:hypothetical protein